MNQCFNRSLFIENVGTLIRLSEHGWIRCLLWIMCHYALFWQPTVNAPPPTHVACFQTDRDVTWNPMCVYVCAGWCLMGRLDELSPGTMGQKKNLSEPPELCPFPKPDLALTQSFNLLSSEDWWETPRGCMLQYFNCTSRLENICDPLYSQLKNAYRRCPMKTTYLQKSFFSRSMKKQFFS